MPQTAPRQETFIHPSAVVEPSVKLGVGVHVGPFCHLFGTAEVGDRVTLHSHVALGGHTTVGEGCKIFPFASIGHAPQDLKYQGEKSILRIGAHNRIREYVTMQAGTESGAMETVVGDHCLFMACSHVAHDCVVGNHVIMANSATLAGHVHLEDHVIIGGLSGIHQRVRIGHHAIIGGMSGVEKDVIPYGLVKGERANLHGLNLVGLKRHGFSREELEQLQGVFHDVFEVSEGTLQERLTQAEITYASSAKAAEIIHFMKEAGRSFCLPSNG